MLSPQLRADSEQPQLRPSILLGGGEPTAKVAAPIDPRLPTGSRIESRPRPTGLTLSACGLRQPVCAHADARSAPLLPAYVAALEEAYAQIVGALGLPRPLPDAAGPDSGLDLYLQAPERDELEVASERRSLDSDRSSAFCRARPRASEARRQASLCVAEALLLGLDAAETPYLRRAIAASLWQALGNASDADLLAIDRYQANPQLSTVGRELSPESAGAALFVHYLDQRLRAGRRGILPAALVQMSRRDAPSTGLEWNNEPDSLDVLRRAFVGSKQSFDDFLLGFAVWRAFLGSRDDGSNAPELLWLGDAGRVRFEWAIKASSLPRRVAPLRPIEPLGSTYLWLEMDRAWLGKSLAFHAEWEEPAAFRWTLVAIDGNGKPLKRYDLPFVQRGTSAERTIVDYQDASAFLIVGISVGGVDLAHPIDPDHEPLEPHGFTVYLTEI
ncbi:MAG TPA: hypothetical protein VFS67_30075 [Polyangiaceae bacterium]|nr:hypothetical protein [Polyangiaceae bacterium]